MTLDRSFFDAHSTVLASLAIASLGLGFFLGARSSPQSSQEHAADNEDATADETKTVESIPDGDLSSIRAGLLEPCKMVLVVRTDLDMNHSTIAEHCGRATLACYKTLDKRNPQLVRHWKRTGQAKIALKAKSEKQLLELEAAAKSLHLCARASMHCSAESMQNEPQKHRTVLAIGPGPVEIINRVTGKLRLL